MTDLQRVKKIINWLIFQGIADNEKELAELLGYTKSSFSQLVNGKVPLSDKFIKKLCSLDKNINEVWISGGAENMLYSDNLNSEKQISIPVSAWNVIQKQAQSLEARDKQIDELISILKDQIQVCKKMAALSGEPVNSAVAG